MMLILTPPSSGSRDLLKRFTPRIRVVSAEMSPTAFCLHRDPRLGWSPSWGTSHCTTEDHLVVSSGPCLPFQVNRGRDLQLWFAACAISPLLAVCISLPFRQERQRLNVVLELMAQMEGKRWEKQAPASFAKEMRSLIFFFFLWGSRL